MSHSISSYLFIATVALHLNAFSANWKSLGNDWYVDLDSAKKYGDIGEVDFRYKDASGHISFDCVRRIVITPERWADRGEIEDNGSPISQMFKSACSKWYEVWKR